MSDNLARNALRIIVDELRQTTLDFNMEGAKLAITFNLIKSGRGTLLPKRSRFLNLGPIDSIALLVDDNVIMASRSHQRTPRFRFHFLGLASFAGHYPSGSFLSCRIVHSQLIGPMSLQRHCLQSVIVTD